MKLLNDCSMFRETPPLQRNDECGRIYCSPREKKIVQVPILLLPESGHPLCINAMFRGRAERNYHYRQELGIALGVEYVREGSLIARKEKRCFLIEPGEIFLMSPGVDCELVVGPERFCVKDSFSVRGALLKPYLETSGLGARDCLCDFDWQTLDRLLDRLQELALKNEPDDLRANSVLTYEILEFLAGAHRRSENIPVLSNLLDYMRANLEKTLSVRELGRKAGYSESGLLRLFRSVYGKTPHRILVEMRMELAAKLLLSPHPLPVKEIAARAGYPNPENFSTAFRHFYGKTPCEYRRTAIF